MPCTGAWWLGPSGVGGNFDAGAPHHATVVWLVTVMVPTLLVAAVYWLLASYSLIAALALDVVILYLTLGFRQFSHYFTDIRDALERGDELAARQHLAEWQHVDVSELAAHGIAAARHRALAVGRPSARVWRVFLVRGPVDLGLRPGRGRCCSVWAEFASRYWAFRSTTLDTPVHERLNRWADRAFDLIDHVPARLTATGFAIVGNFEEAVNGWRRDANLWAHVNEGVILAAAAGAVGVQLGGAAAPGMTPDRSKTLNAGAPADANAAMGSNPWRSAPYQPLGVGRALGVALGGALDAAAWPC